MTACLTDAEQIKRVVKKIKKSQSLVAAHISTPIIALDLEL